jgi:hypothetical protein
MDYLFRASTQMLVLSYLYLPVPPDGRDAPLLEGGENDENSNPLSSQLFTRWLLITKIVIPTEVLPPGRAKWRNLVVTDEIPRLCSG